MLPANPHNPADPECPSVLELAAWTDRRLGEEENNRLEVHAAGCPRCMRLLTGLAEESALIESESRMLVVSDSVLDRAMSLRPDAAKLSIVTRESSRWIIGLRRGLAAAAAIGVIVTGYQVGHSLTGVSTAQAQTPSADVFAIGLLSTDSLSESDDLFTWAFDASGVKAEGTP